jgi:DNA-binding XRE family transcriptional regulator
MNDTAQSPEESGLIGIPESNRTEIIYPWTAPNWRVRVDPNHGGVAVNQGARPASEPPYPWQTAYQKPTVRQPEPQPQLQPISRECVPFGQRIRELRRARGWTQRQAASALGVNVRTVIRHERRRTRKPWWSLLETVRRLEKGQAGEFFPFLWDGGR